MNPFILWTLIGALLLLGLVYYPHTTLGILGSFLRGVYNLAVDLVGMLLAWI